MERSGISGGFGYLFLPRVTVLGNKIAGVSSQFYILDFFLGDTGFYYFANVDKIGQNVVRGYFTGFLGFFDDRFKAAPLNIAEVWSEFTAIPEFNAIFVDVFNALEQRCRFF